MKKPEKNMVSKEGRILLNGLWGADFTTFLGEVFVRGRGTVRPEGKRYFALKSHISVDRLLIL